MDNDLKELRRRNRRYKQELNDLTVSVSQFLALLDVYMKQPSSNERGRHIGRIATELDVANDGALRFALGQSFQSINQRKTKMARRAETLVRMEAPPGNPANAATVPTLETSGENTK